MHSLGVVLQGVPLIILPFVREKTMKIIKNTPVKLSPPSFEDKNVYGDHLNDMPIFSCLNQYSAVALVGSAGSGKTSFLFSLLQRQPKIYRKTVDLILVVQPPHSRASIKSGNVLSKLPEDRFYNELNQEVMAEIKDRIAEAAAEGKKSFLLMDDVAAMLKRSGRVEGDLKDLIFNRRHYKLSVFITLQVYNSLQFSLRKSLSAVFLFYRPSKKEAEQVFSEQLERSQQEATEVSRLTYTKKHTFIFICTQSQRVFSNWDEVIFDSDDQDQDG